MFFLLGSGSGSPVEARVAHRGDMVIIIVLLIAIAAVLGIAFIVWMRIKNYYKSEAYIEKERNRKTKLKDVQSLQKKTILIRQKLISFGKSVKSQILTIFSIPLKATTK